MAPLRTFLDEDVHSGLAHALRKRGYDVIHAQELDQNIDKGKYFLDTNEELKLELSTT